ncbi:hypothetical protein D3C84_345500 [compost metagenome]
MPDVVHLAYGVVFIRGRRLEVAVGQVLQADFSHQATLVARAPGAWIKRPPSSNTNSL